MISLPRAVIFDWDNTLVNSWGAIADAINTVLRHFGQDEWDIETVKARCIRSARESFPEWFGDRWQEASDIFYARFSEVQMQNLAPMPGAGALLEWLHKQGIICCVVSNKNGVFLRAESTALGWDGYFASIVGATDAMRDKPAREHADHALHMAGLQSGIDILFVGDSEADIACARNAGCTPLLIGDHNSAKKLGVDLYVADCGELQSLLSQAARAIA